ncbi:thioredoxin family protein [candidate division KSB1 bacterium]|nr:thioredoxin family protein [candidate division KSB1 bacterium]
MQKVFLVVFILAGVSYAQFGSQPQILTITPYLPFDGINPGQEFKIALEVNIDQEFHINSDKPNMEFMIPTVLKFEQKSGFSFSPPVFPKPQMAKFSFSEEKLSVFKDKFFVFVPVSSSPHLEPGEEKISGTLSFQGCTDNMCFAPQDKSFEILFEVLSEGQSPSQINTEIFAKFQKASLSETNSELTETEQKVQNILARGLFYAIASFFLIGLALNLTPCVYPVIPITVSYFGGQAKKSKGSSFLNAVFYQIGIAFAFAVLGLLSGFAGKQWGFLFQSPWFVVVIAVIMLSLAASMFGAFEITVPTWLMTKVSGKREGVLGALFMGVTAGVVIAPCAAGIIIGLVGLVAKMGLVFKGTLLFFIMGLGLGVPYLILATFSGLLNRLPQSGMWMLWVRKLFGMLLIGVAIYFLIPQLEVLHDKLSFFLGFLGIFTGLFLGFLDQSHGYTFKFKIGRGIFGALLILGGLFWTYSAIHFKPAEIDWIKYNGQTMEELLKNEKPVFIDFYADWCAPCKELDRETFPDPRIVHSAKSFAMLKVDCTSPDSKIRAFMDNFNVDGLPTLVFITKNGIELNELREIRFINAERLEKSLQATLSR